MYRGILKRLELGGVMQILLEAKMHQGGVREREWKGKWRGVKEKGEKKRERSVKSVKPRVRSWLVAIADDRWWRPTEASGFSRFRPLAPFFAPHSQGTYVAGTVQYKEKCVSLTNVHHSLSTH